MCIVFYNDNVAFLFDIKALSRLSDLKRANLANLTGVVLARKQETNKYALPKQLSETSSYQVSQKQTYV